METKKIEDVSRRECLHWIIGTIAGVVLTSQNAIANTLVNENSEIISRSIKASWKNEFDFFLSFFSLNWESEEVIIEKIIQIQKEWDLDEDGVIWDNTLKFIYKNYYSSQKEKLTNIQRERLEIEENMEKYKHKQKAINGKSIKSTTIPNVWNNNRFFWWDNFESVELYEPTWEHKEKWISQSIFDSIDWIKVKNIFSFKANSIYIFEHQGWFVLAVFDKNGELNILSSTSPWRDDFPSIQNKKVNKLSIQPNINHVSSTYPEELENWNVWWAPMPYSVNIYGGYKIHGSADIVDWKKRSHGCFRLPLYYAKKVYEYTKKYSPSLYIWDLWYNKK